MKVKWTRDPQAEKILKEFGLAWKEITIPMSSIDVVISRKNRGRHEAIVKTHEEYACAMKNGNEFPKIIVRKEGGKFIIVGGNNRHAAAVSIGVKDIDCYEIETDDSFIIEALPGYLNRKHGERIHDDEAFDRAIHLIKNYNKSPKEIAGMLCLNLATLRNRITASKVSEELLNNGLDPKQISQTVKLSLNKFIDSEPVFKSLASTITKSKMNQDQAGLFIESVAKERNEKSRLDLIKKTEQDLKIDSIIPKPFEHRKMAIRTKFLQALAHLEGVTKNAKTLDQLQITEKSEKEQVSSRITSLCKKLRKLCQGRSRSINNGRA